jgi:TolA-binding protein
VVKPLAVAAVPQAQPQDRPAVTVSARVEPGGLELHFRWNRAVPAAVFTRGDRLWAVFAGEGADVAGWRSLGRPDVAHWLDPLTTQTVDGARAFRFQLRQAALVDAQGDATGWRITLAPPATPSPTRPGNGLTRAPAGGALEAAADGEVVRLRDPDSGERLEALLSALPGLRQPSPMRLVDLEVLPTIQGYAWRALADDVVAQAEGGRLAITRPGGLRLSTAAALQPPSPAIAAPTTVAPPATSGEEPSLDPALPKAPLGLGALEVSDAPARQQARQRILGQVSSLPGLPRALARLELARLYLADALGPEACTALELVDLGSLVEPAAGRVRMSRNAMTGAAEALAGRGDRALAALLDHVLDEDPEVALWRAFAAAGTGRWQLATQEWQRSDGLLEHYPTPLRRRLGLEMAAAMLDHNDATEARSLLAQLQPLPLSGTDRARLRLLDGIAKLGDGRTGEASADLTAAAAAGDSDIATRAAFLLADAQARDGSLQPEAAAEGLAAQRPRWGGHPWESRMLRRLAELQAVSGRDADAMATWRQALARASDPADAATSGAEMRQHLRGLLAGTRQPGPTPLARLALYRAYGSMLADDPSGPAIGPGLAEAAAASGLLETAAALLGAPATVAAGAAQRQAELALAEAQAAAGDIAAARIRAERLAEANPGDPAAGMAALWRARAALAAGEPAAALAALAALGQAATPEAGRVRREALWRQGDWRALAEAAESELGSMASGPPPPATAEAAAWLGLARFELGQPAEAAAVEARIVPTLGDAPAAALLRLATATPPATVGDDQLPPAMKGFASAVGAALGRLPPLGVGPAADEVKTAGARSAPAG